MATARGLRVFLASLVLAAGLNHGASAQTPKVGDKAPAFALPATTAKEIKLADFAGKKAVVLFFYIAAFTNA
ncbi:MAG: hypothetical protein EHM59_07295 [Betaproteobacteria bacterium]|nr:MAG: hypothetical protein EHM59_07295 [Betaproteobacteria bacterium]